MAIARKNRAHPLLLVSNDGTVIVFDTFASDLASPDVAGRSVVVLKTETSGDLRLTAQYFVYQSISMRDSPASFRINSPCAAWNSFGTTAPLTLTAGALTNPFTNTK